ncbi:hypothetical protein Bca4012_063356 [Brassica carinata]
MVQSNLQEQNMEKPQVLNLSNICMIDGSWTSTSRFSGYGWVWMDSLGKAQLMETRNYIRRESALHSELEALRWAMENMLQHSTCQSFGTDCKDLIAMIKEPQEDGKAEDTDKEQECVPTIISIFRSIKQSEDVTDITKSKNSHAICELGLSVINQLTQKETDLKGEFTPAFLPPTLYKPSEKN